MLLMLKLHHLHNADGKHLLEEQLKLVKLLKSKIVEVTNKEMEL